MEEKTLCAHMVGWGLVSLCLKQGITLSEALLVAEDEVDDPRVRPLFAEYIAKCEETLGQVPEDFQEDLTPLSARELVALGWSTGMLDIYADKVHQLLRLRLDADMNHPRHSQLLWTEYFVELISSGLPVLRVIGVLEKELDIAEYRDFLGELRHEVTERRPLGPFFDRWREMMGDDLADAIIHLEQTGDLEMAERTLNELRAEVRVIEPSHPRSFAEQIEFYTRTAAALESGGNIAEVFERELARLPPSPFREQWQVVMSAEFEVEAMSKTMERAGLGLKDRFFLCGGLNAGILDQALRALSDAYRLCERFPNQMDRS